MLVPCFSLRAFFLSVFLLVSTPIWALGAAPRAAKLAGPEVSSIARDIAAAGVLRSQAQRLAKLYLQAGLGLNTAAANRQIGLAVVQVDGELLHLRHYSERAATLRPLVRTEGSWKTLRAAVLQSYSPAATDGMGALAEELTIHAGKLAMEIESTAETPVGRLLDLSSRLNMLAQRLARLYMLGLSGNRSQGLPVDLAQTRLEFMAGLHELEAAPESSLAAREALSLIRNQWIFFDNAVRQVPVKGGDRKVAENVATCSERIAESLGLMTAQYAQELSSGGSAAK